MCDKEHKNKVKDMVNYNQMVSELLTTCHPHSPINKGLPKLPQVITMPTKPNPLCFVPNINQEQRLSTDEVKQNQNELGAYCNY